MKNCLRISATLCVISATSSLTSNGRLHTVSSRSWSLFMSEPPSDSSTRVKASATTTPTTTSTEVPLSPQTAASSERRRKQRRNWQSGRTPAVDSTLLRFIAKEKENLEPFVYLMDHVVDSVSLSSLPSSPASSLPLDEVLPETIPYDDKDSLVSEKQDQRVVVVSTEKANATTTSHATKSVLQGGRKRELSWWGQYNSHRVETVLMALDPTLDRTSVARAASRVQSQVLARTVRRRIRTFLKERDQSWKSNLVSALTIGSVGEMIQYSGDHSFEDTMRVLESHGITPKDAVDILLHSPGIVLMRPRGGSENGECLDDTVDRIFKLLCVKLKLRKYDARKIVRASPGLLTMRGSKSAQTVVTLLERMGVSPNSVARDKAALTVFLSRSPAALFRLVAFLSSDAIRMSVDKIGPLLRRPVSQELLNAVAPVPQQVLSSNTPSRPPHRSATILTSAAAATATEAVSSSPEEEALEEEMDPWVVSALWGRQSQIRRDRINDIYRRMTKTAWTLRNKIGTADLSKIIAAYPSVLLLDAEEQILPNAQYLMDNLGMSEDDLPRVLQLYPALLGLPIEKMQGVSTYLVSLGVMEEDLLSIFRSFPAILTLDIAQEMEPVVHFLRQIGVINIGRFVTRVPPILGFSVERELLPKWQLLQAVTTHARFEVTKFPAYFSYPLERVIKARYEYIRDIKKIPTQLLSADKVLSYGDYDFAVEILKERDEGVAFRAFLENRNKSQQLKTKKKAKREAK